MADAALYDLVRMQTLSIGTVSTLALSLGVLGFRTFVEAGVIDGSTIHYAIEQTQPSPKRETCTGVYDAGAQTITRVTLTSNNNDSPISIDSGGDAQILIAPNSDDFLSNGLTAEDFPAVGDVNLVAIRRQLRNVPDIFDFVEDDSVITAGFDFTDTLIAAEEAAWNNEIRSLYIPYTANGGEYFTVNGPQIIVRSGLLIYGDGSSMSQFKFTDLSGGFFWDAENFAGGGLQKIGLIGSFSGGNGSYMMRVGGGTVTESPHQFVARNLLISTISGTVSYGVLVDGTAFPGDSGGMRAAVFDNIKIFNTTAIAFDNRYVRSCMYNNINIFQGTGNNEIMNFTGLADTAGFTRTSVGIMLSNIRCNDLVFDRAIDIHGAPVAIKVNVSCSANTSNLQLFGAIASFTNAGGATNQVFRQSTGAFTSSTF